jgi:hypothetical protein
VAHVAGAADPEVLATARIATVVDVFGVEPRAEARGAHRPAIAGRDVDVEQRRALAARVRAERRQRDLGAEARGRGAIGAEIGGHGD